MSPTARTLAKLRSEGWRPWVVEYYHAYKRRRVDLYGCIDIIAVSEQGTLAVQACSGSDVARRVAKVTEAEALPDMRAAGWTVQVHGWRKNAAGRWVCKVVDLS